MPIADIDPGPPPGTEPTPSDNTMPLSLVLHGRKRELIKSIGNLRDLVMTIEKRMDAECEEVARLEKLLIDMPAETEEAGTPAFPPPLTLADL